jgi:integrase
MGVKVRDLKGDGNAWIIVYRKGKRKQRKIGDWDQAHALAKEIEAEDARSRAGLPDPLPLKIVLEDHQRMYVSNLKHSTQVLQSGQIKNHLIPEFGHLDARDIQEANVVAFIEAKLQRYSPSFVRGCVNVLRKALRRLRRSHPDIPELTLDTAEIFERAETSRAEEIRSIDSWTFEEAEKLLRLVRKDEPRYYPLILTLLHTGCRRGEALGMKWSDVDFKRRRIAIRRARVNSRTVLPKHRKKRDAPRFVAITPAMEDALTGLRTFRYKRSGGWVFASRNGTPLEETTAYRAWTRIRTLLASYGVRPLTMHSLRHTFATLSLESGKSVKWVSQQLGHRDAALTLNVYAHALPDEERDLSYLPGSGAGAGRRYDGANQTLIDVTTEVSA